jgi:hypothetical protein
MKDLLDFIGSVLFVCFVFGIFFVFSGTPDLWDVWHEKAMSASIEKLNK